MGSFGAKDMYEYDLSQVTLDYFWYKSERKDGQFKKRKNK